VDVLVQQLIRDGLVVASSGHVALSDDVAPSH
jgi:hypothetical protein